jgi:hypothetical protein
VVSRRGEPAGRGLLAQSFHFGRTKWHVYPSG